MMKEICAQCLQPHIDPATGERSYVFSCFNQDQNLDEVDFDALGARLKQNSLQEKLTAQWIDRCMKHLGARPDAYASPADTNQASTIQTDAKTRHEQRAGRSN